MNLLKNVLAKDLFLIIKDVFIISDIHVGYEESMHKQGYLIPIKILQELKIRIEHAMRDEKIKTIIINGDLIHSFGKLSLQERMEVKNFILFLNKITEVVIIQGNHDKAASFVFPELKLIDHYIIEDILITHGDFIHKLSEDKKIKTIIIGHEHPSISLTSGYRTERYKCFLKGKYKKKNLIVTPSCNLLVEGTDILKERLLSPYLKNIEDFEAYIISDKIYDFGKIKKLRELK